MGFFVKSELKNSVISDINVNKIEPFRFVGEGAYIPDDLHAIGKENISIGMYTVLGINNIIYSTRAKVTIGNYVMTGPNVTIVTGDHRTDFIGEYMIKVTDKMKLPENDKPVVIEDDVWIGAGAIILKGVTIGRGSIVSAGAVVRKNIPPYTIHYSHGNERPRFTEEQILKHEENLSRKYSRISAKPARNLNQNMNILFSVGYLSTIPFANNNIEILLADTLAARGHNCYITGISHDDDVYKITEQGTVVQSWGVGKWLQDSARNFNKAIDNLPKNEIRKEIVKFIIRHPLYALGIFVLRTDYPYKTADKRYLRKVRKIIKEKNIDAVIGFCYPFDKVKLLFDADLPVKRIYYQFDPYGMHETLDTDKRDIKIKDEVDVISKSHIALTTKALASQYLQHYMYSTYWEKIKGLDFPVLVQKQPKSVEIPFDFKKENTNILFCGTMDDGFRNPDFLMENFEGIFRKDSSIKVYFLGTQQGVKVMQWAEKYPDNVFVHPGVKNDIAVAATYKADILLNIGNAISNMVPSKIFDYFATGKPVINVQKIENSPDIEYFEKYPIQFTLPEYTGELQSENLYKFIAENKGNHIDFEIVKDLYYTATPEYVASLIENALK